jgi:ABC-type glycerol-3-phosphate transport system substrate-binding protein
VRPTRRAFLLGGVAAAASPPWIGRASAGVELEALIPSTTWAPRLVEAFNARAAGRVHVRLEQVPYNQLNEKMAAYVAAGRSPDVARAFTGYTGDWQAQGLIDPVDDVLDRRWLDALWPVLRRPPHGDIIDGRLYMAYYSISLVGILARRDLLSASRIDPYGLATFDQLIAAAERLARDGPVRRPIGLTLGSALAAAETSRWIFSSYGLEHIADFSPERRQAYVSALGTMVRLAPLVPDAAYTWDYGQAGQAFAEGVTAFYPIGTWYFATVYKQAPYAVTEARVVPIPYPGGPGGPGQSVKLNANGWYLIRGGRQKAAAAEFLRFATARETIARHVDDGSFLPFAGATVDELVQMSQFGEAQRWYFRDWLRLLEAFPVTVDTPYVAVAETQQIWHETIVNLMRRRLSPEAAYAQLAQRIVPLQQRLRRG